jgi:N-acetylmuramoyl-L-alanine amidase
VRDRFFALCLALLMPAVAASGQSPPATPLRLLTPQGSRPLPSLVVNDIEMVALDELARVFPIVVREDPAAHAITVTWQGRTAVLTSDQALASVNGRLVSLPAAPVRIAGKWFVPVEFIARGLAAIADGPLELRKPSRLVIAGGARVPRISVRYETPGPDMRVVIDITPPAPHSVTQETGRLVIHFEADALDASIPPPPPQPLVQSVTLADTGTALALQLGPRFGSFRASDVPGEANTARFMIDVLPAAEAAPPSPATGQPTAPATPSVPAIPPSSTAAGVHVIVIDPGHGGDDAGARGRKGTLEKDVTLGVARRLRAALESRIAARVLLTRDEDRNVPEDDRAATANNNKGDVFVSLHVSGATVQSLAGASVYWLGLDQHASPASDAAGQSGGISMPVFGGGTRDIDVIPWHMAQAHHIDDSAMLARRVEGELRGSGVPMNARALVQAPLRVLVGANMPAVLVDMGYLTNPAQEPALAGADLQARVARAVADAIVRFDGALRSLGPPPTP